MPRKITQEWVLERLDAINATWLEREAELKPRKITDVKRKKSSLTDEELERIRNAINLFR